MDMNLVRMTVGYVASHKNSKSIELTQKKKYYTYHKYSIQMLAINPLFTADTCNKIVSLF